MLIYSRKISVFKIIETSQELKINNKNHKTIGFLIPELVYITLAIKKIKQQLGDRSYYENLYQLLDELKSFCDHSENGYCRPGVIPLNGEEAERFINSLYNELAQAGIPLPGNIEFEELKFWQNFKNSSINDIKVEHYHFSILIQNPKLSFFEWLLPTIGYGISLLLISGLSASSAVTILTWGWPSWGLFICITAKLTANYVDIQGGPENRLRKIAEFFKRFYSGLYINRGKWSSSKLLLYSTVGLVLSLSAYVSWFYALNILKNITWLKFIGNGAVYYLSNLFAGSMFYSSFGRLFNPLYQKIYPFFDKHFNLSEVDDVHCFIDEDLERLKQLYETKCNDNRELTVEYIHKLLADIHPNYENNFNLKECVSQRLKLVLTHHDKQISKGLLDESINAHPIDSNDIMTHETFKKPVITMRN